MAEQRLHVGPRLSQVVVHGNTVYTAGIVADDANADVGGQAIGLRRFSRDHVSRPRV